MRRVRRECENRVDQYEECMVQLQSDIQKEVNKQVELLQKAKKELRVSHPAFSVRSSSGERHSEQDEGRGSTTEENGPDSSFIQTR